MINGFYELGILDPDVDRGTVRDAARSLMAISLRDDVSPRQIQRLVEQVLQTFYEWPLMLPSNLVYFGRAGVLVEGIGLRYDPNFNALALARPVLDRAGDAADPAACSSRTRGAGSPTGRRKRSRRSGRCAISCGGSSATSSGSARTRGTRSSSSGFSPSRCAACCSRCSRSPSRSSRASCIAATRRLEVLVVGLLIAFGMFLVIFLLPTHLFQNPLRFRKNWPPR